MNSVGIRIGRMMSSALSGSDAISAFPIISFPTTSGAAGFAVAPPAIVHPSTSLSTCSGCRKASSCASIPAIETPKTLARLIPSALSGSVERVAGGKSVDQRADYWFLGADQGISTAVVNGGPRRISVGHVHIEQLE